MSNNSGSKKLQIIAGPLLAVVISQIASPVQTSPYIMVMLGITIWIALWWFTEAVHIAITSLIPFLLLPAIGISNIKEVAAQYMDPVLFLFIGGFFLAFAIERWGLHKRIALKILSVSGKNASMLLFGVMITSYLISMWISNTATVMMLLSAVLSVITQVDNIIDDKKHHRKLASALLIGLAYAATIGGMATLVGTPPNMIFFRAYTAAYPTANDLTFLSWFKVGFPVSILMLICAWLILQLQIPKKELHGIFNTESFKNEYKTLGKISKDEKIVGGIFILTAILWFTRADLDFGSWMINGWANLFPFPNQIQDSTVAIGMSLLLFLIPSQTEPKRNLLEWKETSKLPFDIILLFGSGFALAKGFEESGLSNYLASLLIMFKGIHPLFIILIICTIITIISEFASNVASIQLALPILISLQQALQLPPLLLLLPATLAASLGFMLPVATAPNTIVFSSGQIKVKELANTGILVNISGIIIITMLCYLLLF
jgi:sodium-dependent dicarboxylate transporter 2/3/5